MALKRIRIDSRLAALAAALLAGAVAYVAARHHLASEERAAEARIAERHQKKAVLVARADLAAGTLLDSSLLATRQIPVRYLSRSVALPQDVERVEGQRLVHEARGGEPILWPSLAGGGHAALSAALASGRRALTFPVDEVNALSGMLMPGDVIDLLYTAAGAAGGASVRPLLQRVTVLATGSTTRPDTGGAEGGRATDAQFATITLSVTPEEAQLIVLAQRAGELTAVLRHPADAVLQPARAVDVSALAGRTPRAAALAPRDYVDVITGGSRGVASRTRLLADEVGPATETRTRTDEPAQGARPARAAPSPDAGDVRSRLGLDRPPSP